MKKIFSVFFLLVAILIAFSYSLLYFSFNLTSSNNFINNRLRKKFISSYQLRKIFKLNQTGDARFDYGSSKKFTKLRIIIYYQEEESLRPETMPLVIQELKLVVDKPEGITVEEIPLDKSVDLLVDDEDLRQLIKAYPLSRLASEKTATVQIFLLGKYAPVETFLGVVKDSSNIFLFMETIRDFSRQQKSTKNIEISTLLHELAHLLGADHVENEDCLLSERVEDLAYGSPLVIRDHYCPEDLSEIQKALSF